MDDRYWLWAGSGVSWLLMAYGVLQVVGWFFAKEFKAPLKALSVCLADIAGN